MALDSTDSEIGRVLVEISLIEDPKEQGVTRDKLGALLHISKSLGFTITIRELNAVHGSWDKNATSKEQASLLVLRAQLHDNDPSRGRRFKNVRVGLQFSSAKENSLPADDPKIACFSPAKDHMIHLLPTSVLREKKRLGEISLDVDADPAPVMVGAKLSFENSWQWQRDVMASISGTARQEPFSKGHKGDNFVEWVIAENKYGKRNANSVDVAVLLHRPNDAAFLVNFSGVEASVDFLHTVKEKVDKVGDGIKKLLGIELPSNVVTFNPTEQGDCPDGVDSENLKDLEDGDVLDKYAFTHIVDKVRGVCE